MCAVTKPGISAPYCFLRNCNIRNRTGIYSLMLGAELPHRLVPTYECPLLHIAVIEIYDSIRVLRISTYKPSISYASDMK